MKMKENSGNFLAGKILHLTLYFTTLDQAERKWTSNFKSKLHVKVKQLKDRVYSFKLIALAEQKKKAER